MTAREGDWVWGGIVAPVLIVVVVFLGLTIATDNDGRQGNDHAGPLPAKVVRLTPKAYLSSDRTLSPTRLCGSYGSATPVEHTNVVSQLDDTLFVECNYSQHWNVHQPRSPSFWHAAARVAQDATFLVAAGFIALAFAPMWLYGLGAYRKRVRRERRRRRADAEAQRQALATAYARGEIEQPEFEKKLEEVLNVD